MLVQTETLPITFSICQRLCIKNSILFFPPVYFQILDKVNNIIQVHCPVGGRGGGGGGERGGGGGYSWEFVVGVCSMVL